MIEYILTLIEIVFLLLKLFCGMAFFALIIGGCIKGAYYLCLIIWEIIARK